MQLILRALTLTATTILTASCSSGGLFSTPALQVVTDPPEAEVMILSRNGVKKIGKSPVKLTSDHLSDEDRGAIHIAIHKAGFNKEHIFIDSRWFGKTGQVAVKLTPEANWNEAYQDPQAYKYLNDVASVAAEVQSTTVKGDLNKAETMAKSLVTRYPKLSVGWNLLGNIYYLQRRVSDALTAYRKSLDIDPENKETQEVIKRLGGSLESARR